MRNFLNLEIWKRSHQLTLKIYKITKYFPKEELFGLTSQMRRSSSSIPTNIAEVVAEIPTLNLRIFFK